MPINVKISLCKITAASKLFQRNYYLPLLKPLSPKDAVRRKIITGQNVLGSRIEHYIPVLTRYEVKSADRKSRGKGEAVIKKRIRMGSKSKYVAPFLDEDLDNHPAMMNLFARKGRGKGQHYAYEIPDKNATLVINYQFEKALKDKDIVDIMMAQRSEKIVVKLANGLRVTMPLAPYEGGGSLYRGSGFTKEIAEEEHHHGKETMSIAKVFEAKESGVDEWELEMMRLASKRKKKTKGGESADWKQMMAGCVDNMDWDKFEEDSKKIVDEIHDVVEEENIPMAVDDMEKTKNVGEKLKSGGNEILNQLPSMLEIPEVIKSLGQGDLCEILNVSGAKVGIKSGKVCFVPGQMVKTDEDEVFVPGQTLEDDNGVFAYVPGVTILEEGEPVLIPGLVMGEEETSPMFLPGESAITGDGQLKFEGTEADFNPDYRDPSPPLPFEEGVDDDDDEEEEPPPTPTVKTKKGEEPVVIRRRVIDEPEPVVKERVKKRPPIVTDMAKGKKEKKAKSPPIVEFRPERQPKEDPLKLYEERMRQQEEEENKRAKQRYQEKIATEEAKVDKLRIEMYKKYRNMKFERPKQYVPMEPVKKSSKLAEMEESISRGTFLEDERTKSILDQVRSQSRLSKYNKAFVSFTEFDRYSSSTLGSSRTKAF